MTKPFLIVLFAVAAVLTALIYFAKRREERIRQETIRERRETVEKTSLKYKSLSEYNSKWSFGEAPVELTYTTHFPTRADAKSTDADGLLAIEIRAHYDEVMSALREVDRRKEQYQRYLDQMRQNLRVTPESFIEKTGIEISEFRKTEDELCKTIVKEPHDTLIVTIKKTYTDSEQSTRALVRHCKGEELEKAIHNVWSEKVLSHSDSIAKMEAINNTYKKLFIEVKPRHTYQKYCSSINEFRKYENSDLFIKEKLREDRDEILAAIDGAKENRKYYDQYLKRISEIGPSAPDSIKASGVPEQVFRSIEQAALQNNKLTEPSFSQGVVILYSSPKRGNGHEFKRDYSYEQLLDLLEEQKRAEFYRAQRNEERSKMTNSLRYDIMKRDGFRCVLCGASRSDGAMLHVDHIIPVSKGGKTIESNLRTLCDRCNSGKRDKYDPAGMN